jgi:hypothetical protein
MGLSGNRVSPTLRPFGPGYSVAFAEGELTMKVVLQDLATRHYCAGSGAWVEELPHAVDFRTLISATQFALAEQLPQTQMVLTFRGLPYPVPVPVLAEWCTFENRFLRSV